MRPHERKLRQLALAQIERTVTELPDPLRQRALALPVTIHARPNAAQCGDGIEPDTLGLFVGNDFASENFAASPLPPQILLFLENLWDQADGQEEAFCEEVRITYLHELGHYLGLDEDDLFDRGLE